jgi:hypothetical protein
VSFSDRSSWLDRRRFLALGAAAIMGGAAHAQTSLGPMGLLVPAYIDPSVNMSAWNVLAATATRLPLIAIMNPSNGPGRRPDAHYIAAVQAVAQSGGRVLGYVHTSYGKRSLSAAQADVDRYFSWYPVAGIFVDEMATNASTRKLNYYNTLATYIRSSRSGAMVVANPGTAFDEAFAAGLTADIFVDAEDPADEVLSTAQAAWTKNYPPRMFAELAYDAGDDAAVVRSLAQRRIAWVYSTKLTASNPWDALPDDFAAEVDTIIAINATR